MQDRSEKLGACKYEDKQINRKKKKSNSWKGTAAACSCEKTELESSLYYESSGI